MFSFDLHRPYPVPFLYPPRIVKAAVSGIGLIFEYHAKHIGLYGQYYDEESYPIELRTTTMRSNFTNAYFTDFLTHEAQLAAAHALLALAEEVEFGADTVFNAARAADFAAAAASLTGIGLGLVAILSPFLAVLNVAGGIAGVLSVAMEALVESTELEIERLEADKIEAQEFYEALPDPFLYDVYDACPIEAKRDLYFGKILTFCAPDINGGASLQLQRIQEAANGTNGDDRAAVWLLLRIAHSRLLIGVQDVLLTVWPDAAPGLPRDVEL